MFAMALSRIDENELLIPLYQGGVDEGAWLVFLARLQRQVRADYAGFLLGRSDGAVGKDTHEYYVNAPGSGNIQHGLQQNFYRANPLFHRLLRPDRIYGIGDLPDADAAEREAYLREVILRGGFADQRLLRIADPGGSSCWLMIARREEMFTATQSALLSALVPHFQSCLRTIAAIAHMRQRAALAEKAAMRLGLGWLTLDEAGRVLDSGGRPLPAGHRDEVSTMAGKLDGTPTARVLHQHDEARIDILAEPLEQAGTGDPAAILWLRMSEPAAGDPTDRLIGLHGLSRMEARLAWALCQGSSLNEAAGEVGLTRETARNYSKRIYAKVGAKGQADLVRLILTGVAPLG